METALYPIKSVVISFIQAELGLFLHHFICIVFKPSLALRVL